MDFSRIFIDAFFTTTPFHVKNSVELEKKALDVTTNLEASIQSLPRRAYFDKTVVPILLTGLAQLSKERPPNPIEYLGACKRLLFPNYLESLSPSSLFSCHAQQFPVWFFKDLMKNKDKWQDM